MPEEYEILYVEIDGMSCSACSAAIERSLKRKDFIKNAEIFLLGNCGKIEFDKARANANDILNLIQKAGYGAKIKNDASKIKNAQIQDDDIFTNDVTSNNIEFKMQSNIEFEIEEKIKPNCALDSKNTKEFVDSTLDSGIQPSAQQNKKNKIFSTFNIFALIDKLESRFLNDTKKLILSIIFTLFIIYLSMFKHFFDVPLFIFEDIKINSIAQLIIALIVMHLNKYFYFRGFRHIFAFMPNMDSLVALGSLSAFLYSAYFLFFHFDSLSHEYLYFEGVCVILCVICIGKNIESSAKNKALSHAKSLLKSKESKVIKIIDNVEFECDQKDIKINDILKILPNMYVPADAILLSESASIDESHITGESLPVEKRKNDSLISGSINTIGPIILKVTKNVQDSTLAHIEKLIQNAITSKSSIMSVCDRVSLYFVPAVIFLAFISSVVWYFLADFKEAILIFASVLLISCPCSLGLAAPMAMLFANAKANKMGIFFKDSISLENASRIKHIFFDKTGTLTTGNLKIKEIFSLSALHKSQIFKTIKSIECNSEHLIATAVKNHIFNENGTLKNISNKKNEENKSATTNENNAIFETLQYCNINNCLNATLKIDENLKNLIGNDHFQLASKVYFKEKLSAFFSQVSCDNFNDIDNFKRLEFLIENENIVIILANENMILGGIILEDELRDDAKNIIDKLKAMNIGIKILSGDNEKSTKNIASILDIKYRANCSAQDKMQEIESLKNNGIESMMIGDGTNDALAFVKSCVAISLGKSSAINIENSNVIIVNDRLDSIINVLKISFNTLKNIKQNLIFAFIYNIICIPIAMGIFLPFGVHINPMIASVAMSLSSISVVMNASRLYYAKI